MTGPTPHLVIRLFLAALLGFFAFAPCYIAFWTLIEIAKAPLSTPWEALVALAVCIPLAYFVLLLVYRAVTWQGRVADGGLLPPLAMLAFAVIFALLGAGSLGFTVWRGEYLKSLLAIGYLAAAIPVVRSYWRRTHGS